MKHSTQSIRIVAGLVIVACHADDISGGRETPTGVAQTALGLRGENQSGEQLFAELASAVSSSAGFYFEDSEGRIVVNVASPSEAGRAVALVRSFLASGRIAIRADRRPLVVPRTVRYSFAQLKDWRDKIGSEVFDNGPDFLSLDLDEVRNEIRLGTRESGIGVLRDSVSRALRHLAIDSQAVRLAEDLPLRTSSGAATWFALGGLADTVVGGLEIGNYAPPFTCTIGFTADYWSNRGFVTASHCIEQGGIWDLDGSVAHQPHYDATAYGAVGIETVDPAPWNCGLFHLCRRSDASFYHSVAQPPRSMQRGLIARPTGLGETTRDPIHPYFWS